MAETKGRNLGRGLQRKEDVRLVKGQGVFLSDVHVQGELVATFLRSPYAHARVKNIEFDRVMRLPGVVMVLTGRDAQSGSEPFPYFMHVPGTREPRQFCLATDKVRFEGEPVACIVADDRYLAEDALDLVNVEYEPLKPVLDPDDALGGQTQLHENIEGNIYQSRRFESGDVDSSFKEAHLTIEKTLRIQRYTGAPIEPHGVLASYDNRERRLIVWATTQMPNGLRKALSLALKLEEDRIRVVARDVGGAFGTHKYHPEDIAVSLASIRLGRPVKWVATRSENFLAGYHARDQIHHLRVAVDSSGKVLALKDKIVAPIGAYLVRETTASPNVTLRVLPGPYDIRNLSLELLCVAVNKAPAGSYRGFGQPEANFVIERVMDMVARRLNLNSGEVRLRNLVSHAQMPYKTATGMVLDSGDYPRCLRRALEICERERRALDESRCGTNSRGIGVAMYIEDTGVSPANMREYARGADGPAESVTLRIGPSGMATLLVGLMPHGQGSETSLAQVASDLLGLKFEDIRVVYGDTQQCPYGYGSAGSRSAVVGSGAIAMAVQELKAKARAIASSILEAREESLQFEKGRFYVRNNPRRTVRLAEIALEANMRLGLPKDSDLGLKSTASYEPQSRTVSYGAHVAVLDVDSETGSAKVSKYFVVHDCGTVLNPKIVEGQIQGGVMQGIGGAMMEELLYSNEGQLLASDFSSYALPTSLEAPSFVTEEMQTPSLVNPIGVKGVGEGGAIPVAAAIAGAIEDALALKDSITETPLNFERVRKLIANERVVARRRA